MNKGKYIVIEGLANDRAELVQRLATQLSSVRLPVQIVGEPEGQNDPTARTMHRLVHDPRYPMTNRTEVLLYNAARIQSLEAIREAVKHGAICLVDHSYVTTLAVQYYGLGTITDYPQMLNIINFAVGDVQADLTVVLDTPVTQLSEAFRTEFIEGKTNESSETFLERVRAGYLWEAKQRNLPVVYANEDIDTVFKNIWQHVASTLAVRGKDDTPSQPQSVAEVPAANPPAKAAAVEPPLHNITAGPVPTEVTVEEQAASSESAITPAEPWTTKDKNGSISVTDAGNTELAKFITNTSGNVYAFTDQMSPITVAAAMGHLSHRGDDLRITLLDEFIGKPQENEQLLHDVIAAYDEDSAQQLSNQYLVVENASSLLAQKLEQGRLASYVEQPTLHFEQKDAAGHYRYYVPESLKGKMRKQYKQTMNQIFDVYSKLITDLTTYIRASSSTPEKERDGAWKSTTKAQARDAIHALLPVAAKSTIGIYASGQTLENLIVRLLSDELPEARTVGQQILDEARKITPLLLEQTDKPEQGGATIAYLANTYSAVKKMAEELLPANHAAENEAVTLSGYTPRNEFDIVADMLYEHSDLPLEVLQREVASWPFQRKVDVFTAYMGERLNRRDHPGRALEKIHYSFDLICDYGTFRDLQRHRVVDNLEWQPLGPRMGYDTPKLVEDAGQSDAFAQCFDLSLELYSALQASGHQLEAQYTVLFGHKMRCKITYTAREAFHLHEQCTDPQSSPDSRKLIQQMHEKVAEVHPLLAESMKFVNQLEDPELARLAAERYTQSKLEQLDSEQKG